MKNYLHRGQGHVTTLEFWAIIISLTRVTLGISNLVFKLLVTSTSVRMIDY